MFHVIKTNRMMLLATLLPVLMATSGFAEIRNKMYVPHPFASEEGKSVVSVYDLDDSRLISTLRTVPAATFARVTPDGRHIWIFSSKEREVEIYDIAVDRVVDRPYLDFPACDAVFDPNGKTCYTANGSLEGQGDNSISYVEVGHPTASYTIATGRNPVSLAIQDDGSRLYVANRGDNSITVIDPLQYRVVTTIYAGIEPHRLVLSRDGKYLFVANRGVDLGRNGGSCVTVIDTRERKVIKVVETGRSPGSIGLTPDESRMVVCHASADRQENFWFYDLTWEAGGMNARAIQRITVGKGIEFGTVDPTGRLFVVPDHVDGGVYVVDMLQPGTLWKADNLYGDRAWFVEFASVDVNREIARRDAVIQGATVPEEAQEAAFEKAYLYQTFGDQNAVVATYNSIIERFPRTLSEVKALFEMGDLCYHQQLLSNAADYYNRGLTAYGELLTVNAPGRPLDARITMGASERLGDLAVTLGKNYFVDLYKLYANIPLKMEEFPQLFFSFGVALRKLGDSKFANKCFTETENRLIELMDETLYQEMRFKIDLVRANTAAILRTARMKRAVTIDGRLDEWDQKDALRLDRRDNVIVSQMRWFDKTDASGSFYVGYDQYNLYVAAEILDDNVLRLSRTNGDYVGLYFDLRDGSGSFLTRKKEIGDGVYSIRVIPPSADGAKFEVETEQDMKPIVAGTVTAEGYSFELKIPLAYLRGFSPDKGRRIGFGIELFDVDSPSSNVPPKVLGWLMPAKSAYGPRFSELFGILEF